MKLLKTAITSLREKLVKEEKSHDTCLHNFHMAINNDSCKHLQG